MSKSVSAQPKKLTDQAALDCTINVLKRHFDLFAEGDVCDTDDLYRVMVNAAAQGSTIEAACADLVNAPDSNTVRGYRNAQFTVDAIRDVEHDCNRALYRQWPHWLWSAPLELAIDLHDECYYGESDDDAPDSWVCRGEKQKGTTHFYRCATIAVVRRRVRVTLGLTFIHPADDWVAVVQKLLKAVRSRGLRSGGLYADKQFCTIPILRYLQKQAFTVVGAVPRQGKTGGVNALCRGHQSYRTEHTFESQPNGPLTVPVAILRAYTTKHDQRTATWLVFVVLRVTASLRHLREA